MTVAVPLLLLLIWSKAANNARALGEEIVGKCDDEVVFVVAPDDDDDDDAEVPAAGAGAALVVVMLLLEAARGVFGIASVVRPQTIQPSNYGTSNERRKKYIN